MKTVFIRVRVTDDLYRKILLLSEALSAVPYADGPIRVAPSDIATWALTSYLKPYDRAAAANEADQRQLELFEWRRT